MFLPLGRSSVILFPAHSRTLDRAFSSGGERFPDTEEVTSSNLVTPTKCSQLRGFASELFCFTPAKHAAKRSPQSQNAPPNPPARCRIPSQPDPKPPPRHRQSSTPTPKPPRRRRSSSQSSPKPPKQPWQSPQSGPDEPLGRTRITTANRR